MLDLKSDFAIKKVIYLIFFQPTGSYKRYFALSTQSLSAKRKAWLNVCLPLRLVNFVTVISFRL